MTHGMDPARMTGPQRLDEMSMLLATAMMRLWLKGRAARRGALPEKEVSGATVEDCLEPSSKTRLSVTAGER
jgi:hypothetical protein